MFGCFLAFGNFVVLLFFAVVCFAGVATQVYCAVCPGIEKDAGSCVRVFVIVFMFSCVAVVLLLLLLRAHRAADADPICTQAATSAIAARCRPLPSRVTRYSTYSTILIRCVVACSCGVMSSISIAGRSASVVASQRAAHGSREGIRHE